MSSSLVPQQRPSASTSHQDSDQESEHIRDIHALTPPHPPPSAAPSASRWDTGSHLSYSMNSEGGGSSENFSSISREFNALVIAGSAIGPTNNHTAGSETIDMGHHHPIDHHHNSLLSRIGEGDDNRDRDGPNNYEETNPLAIVPGDNHPLDQVDPIGQRRVGPSGVSGGGHDQVTSVQRVKKEEVETKISAWQNNKVAKINNRFKREDAVISGWESEQVQKATSCMKKVERKLEEKRARALEKMQNDVAKARRKAEERRASAEAKRGTKVARVFEVANLMRAVGRAPTKRSFF